MTKTPIKQEPCPLCDGTVLIAPSCGGRGTNMMTSYSARCPICSLIEDNFSNDGSFRSAVATWNVWAKEKRKLWRL